MDPIRLWRTHSVSWASAGTADSVAERMAANLTQRHRLAESFGLALRDKSDPSVAGSVDGHGFQIYLYRPGMRGSFRPTLRGEIVANPQGGSSIAGEIAYPLFTRVFAVIWSATVVATIAASLGIFVRTAFNGDLKSAAPILAVAGFGVGMMAFGALVLSLGTSEGRNAQTHLQRWVSELADAA